VTRNDDDAAAADDDDNNNNNKFLLVVRTAWSPPKILQAETARRDGPGTENEEGGI
jgi:hypothetical protein